MYLPLCTVPFKCITVYVVTYTCYIHGLGSNWSKYKSCVHYLDTVFDFSKDNIKQKDKNRQQTTV